MESATVMQVLRILVSGLLATAALMAVSFASQGLGLSRLNFPLLLGTLFTARRRAAITLGFVLYLLIGWVIALGYYLVMALTGLHGVWAGIGIALLHGLFLLLVAMPLLPYVHPRMASPHDGPSGERRLQPPGFLGLHYGPRTPLVLLLAYAIYGGILGFGFASGG